MTYYPTPIYIPAESALKKIATQCRLEAKANITQSPDRQAYCEVALKEHSAEVETVWWIVGIVFLVAIFLFVYYQNRSY